MGKFSYLKPGDTVAINACDSYMYRKVDEVALDKIRIYNHWFDIYTGESLEKFVLPEGYKDVVISATQLLTSEEAEEAHLEFSKFKRIELAFQLEKTLITENAFIEDPQLFREKILEALNLCEFPKPT